MAEGGLDPLAIKGKGRLKKLWGVNTSFVWVGLGGFLISLSQLMSFARSPPFLQPSGDQNGETGGGMRGPCGRNALPSKKDQNFDSAVLCLPT